MIFTSDEARFNWIIDHYNTPEIMTEIGFARYLMEKRESAIMCDGDVRKPRRMLQLAREALDALDKLDAECDAKYCREETDLALDINCAMADVEDIVARLEASR